MYETATRLIAKRGFGVVLWWLLDKTPRQSATNQLLDQLEQLLPFAAPMLALAPAELLVRGADQLCLSALFGDDSRSARST